MAMLLAIMEGILFSRLPTISPHIFFKLMNTKYADLSYDEIFSLYQEKGKELSEIKNELDVLSQVLNEKGLLLFARCQVGDVVVYNKRTYLVKSVEALYSNFYDMCANKPCKYKVQGNRFKADGTVSNVITTFFDIDVTEIIKKNLAEAA